MRVCLPKNSKKCYAHFVDSFYQQFYYVHVCMALYMHTQYMQLLVQLVEVSQSLHLWQTDPLLHGELHLKLACLYEARAEIKGHNRRLGGSSSRPVSNITLVEEGGFFQLYDRKQLLECLCELETGLKCVQMARAEMMEEECGARRRRWGRRKGVEQEEAEIVVLHSEYMFVITRVKIKLASTIPPPRE